MTGFRHLATAYVGLSKRHPWLLLTGFTGLTLIAFLGLRTLKVNTDFRSLLPEDTPSVRALEESEERRGSTELYTIAVQSPDPYANVAMVRDLAERIEAEWPEAQWVQIDEDPSFFQDQILLYMPNERLDTFRRDLDTALDCELAEVNPLFVNLGDDCDDLKVEWTLDFWIGQNLIHDLGLPDDFFGDLEASLTGGGADSDSEGGDAEGTGAAVPSDLRHYIISDDGQVALVYVQLTEPSTNVDFANRMQERGMALIGELDPASYHPEMRAEVVGAYQSLNEAREAVGDSMSALFASLGFVLVIMLGFFRTLRGLIIVFVPLIMGLAWTMGLTRITYSVLNLYTLFVGSVLLGMGIDFGIHLYGRAVEAFRGGLPWDEALVEALDHTGRAILASAVTTVAALLTLLFSHFQGFIEFGVIASYGIVLCMLASYLVVPAMVFAFEAIWPMAQRTPIAAEPPKRARAARRFGIVPAVVTLILVIGGTAVANRAAFEYDFRNYRAERPTSQARIPYGKAVGQGRTTALAIVLGDSEAQMREVHQLLRDRLNAGDPKLKGFITIQTYVPPGQQERMAIIERIGRMVNRRALNRLTGEVGDFIERLRELVDVSPFGIDDVPEWALRSIQETDGTVGRLGLIFRRVQEWNVLDVRDYKSRYAELEVPSGTVPVADGTFITSDIVDTVQGDGSRMGALVAIMLAVVLLVTLRSVHGMLICMITMGAAFALTLGGMVLTETKVGMFNMIVVPAVLGVSIDGAIHVYHRARTEGIDRMEYVLKTTGVAVAAASLTTAGGFAGLLFQNHRGIASIGQLAVIGIVAALIAVFGLMPGLMALTTPAPTTAEKTQEPQPDGAE